MERSRGRQRARGAGPLAKLQTGRDRARSDDARDGRLCGRRGLAKRDALAGYTGHRHHRARSRHAGSRAPEFRGAIRAGQGHVPAGRAGGAHPPVRWRRLSKQREGSGVVIKILYVEDNDDNVYMLKMRLELLDEFEVLVAEGGGKGCEGGAGARPGPDVVGLEVPGVAGGEARRRLKTTPNTSKIPIIALPAPALSGVREKALAAGCDEF